MLTGIPTTAIITTTTDIITSMTMPNPSLIILNSQLSILNGQIPLMIMTTTSIRRITITTIIPPFATSTPS